MFYVLDSSINKNVFDALCLRYSKDIALIIRTFDLKKQHSYLYRLLNEFPIHNGNIVSNVHIFLPNFKYEKLFILKI